MNSQLDSYYLKRFDRIILLEKRKNPFLVVKAVMWIQLWIYITWFISVCIYHILSLCLL